MFTRSLSRRLFTQARTKVLLTQDHEHLGYAGETVFVRPSFAMNQLVNKDMGVISTDPRFEAVKKSIDYAALEVKQKQRLADLFVERLKAVTLHFRRGVSQINRSLVTDPVTPEQILKEIKSKYGLEVQPEDLRLSNTLDSVGDHFIEATLHSPRFDKKFNFGLTIRVVEQPSEV